MHSEQKDAALPSDVQNQNESIQIQKELDVNDSASVSRMFRMCSEKLFVARKIISLIIFYLGPQTDTLGRDVQNENKSDESNIQLNVASSYGTENASTSSCNESEIADSFEFDLDWENLL